MHNVAPRGSGLALHRTDEVKSFSPSKHCAARCIRSASAVRKNGLPLYSVPPGAADDVDDVAITASRGAKSGMKIISTALTQRTAMSPGKFAFTPNATQRLCAARLFRNAPPARCRYTCVSTPGAEDGDRFVRHLGSAFSSFSCTLRTSFCRCQPYTYCRRTQCPAQFYKLAVVAVGH